MVIAQSSETLEEFTNYPVLYGHLQIEVTSKKKLKLILRKHMHGCETWSLTCREE